MPRSSIWSRMAVRMTWCGLYAVVVAALSLAPRSVFPEQPPGGDKIAHFVIYGLFALLLVMALEAGALTPSGAALASFLICTLYGAAMEIAQGAMGWGNRTFSVADMAANALGAGLVVLARLPFRRKRG